ncbi:hypothetical protein CP533_1079 [Ophiocordyceps camponoti-saundersi (nom. inval.)]|nr:hypothetical protein CP533_1079 [Ophiocordyceps camponoti-saundersi (nom. inval.)]
MYNNPDITQTGSHPLLEQVPLTVSPFVSLPTATTLSYNYKAMPSNIPPSALGIPTAADEEQQQPPPPRFVISGSGHVASPQEILESCQALHKHVLQLQASAERELRDFEASIRERDLAEKRRLAPGWLDSDERLLKPEPSAAAQKQAEKVEASEPDPGAELDRAFGGMDLSS